MKVLIISNMYPSSQKPYSGIFVKKQYDFLQKIIERDTCIDIFYMKRSFTEKIGSILKYIIVFFRFFPVLFKKYDVLHLHYFYPLIILLWLYKILHPNVKIIVTFHGSDITLHINGKFSRRIFRVFAKAIDFTIPVGQTIANQVFKKLDLSVGAILPVGIDDRVFYKDNTIDKIYDFIFVGSFCYRKGVDILIDAIKKLPEDFNCKFCFVGSGEYQSEIHELCKSRNIAIFINQTPQQLSVLYNQSKILLLPTRNEGFPTSTLEAMFCGVPVLTSDIPMLQEQVTVGFNGYMHKSEDSKSLMEKLVQLLNLGSGQYQELSKNSLVSFRDISLTNVCTNLLDIYKNVMTTSCTGDLPKFL